VVKLYFYDEKHEENFMRLVERFPQAESNFQYRVACYITSHPEIYFKVEDKNLPLAWAFDMAMDRFEVDFTNGFHQLIKLGMNLWNGWNGWSKADGDPGDYKPFDFDYALGTLDERNYQVLLQAVKIRRRES
jgi:hypothetical protein